MSVPPLRAPREHGQIFAVPGLDQVGTILERNRQQLTADILGQRATARQQVLRISSDYHREAGEVVPDSSHDVWIVAGHQPELFHPGVWFKNFVLHQLARKHGAMSLNLIIDTDAAKPAFLHVPNGDRLARVPFDRSNIDSPYEESAVLDEQTFAELPAKIDALAESWGFEPMLFDFWREAMSHVKRTSLIGERFVAARRAFERRFGVVQHEVPMSRVCQTLAFASFVGHILGELPRFHAIYNQTVEDYRRAHGIVNRSHPVPDLAEDGDWLEAPFWAWRPGQSRRARLFFRYVGREWTLRIGTGESLTITPGDTGALAEVCAHRWKVRPRALTTTMFARLFLGDLFLHGIGGGIYDELTDRIIERFWTVPAPAYLIVSATLLLPLPRFPDATREVQTLWRRLRDMQYQPERFVTGDGGADDLVRSKQAWIARDVATHAERVQRFEALREINFRLQSYVAAEHESTRAALVRRRREVGCDDVAARRDYAFCLYPEAMLREFSSRPLA